MNDITRTAKAQGFALAKTFGGPQRMTYYAPDGSVKVAIPGYLEGTVDGKVVRLDRHILAGYSFTPPDNPKPHCNGCGRWHNTEEEIKACIKKQNAFIAKHDRAGRKKLGKDDGEVKRLEDKLEKLEEMIAQLVKEKHAPIS